MIQLTDLTIAFENRRIIDGVSADFNRGCLTALIGRNGAGKSTLLRVIAGLNKHYSGNVTINSENIRQLTPVNLARLLAFVTTERTRVPNLRCEDVVAIGRAPYTNWIGRMQERDREIVEESLRSVGMESYAKRTMDTMSDGECQRIMIARALAQDTPAILLDEPTSFLDLPNRYELVRLLLKLSHEKGKCIIFSTHELEVALRLCDTIALIDNGRLYHLPVPNMVNAGHIERLFHIPEN